MNFLAQLLNGVALGAGYALLALGWTVLLGAARLVNFAHGQLYMLGAFLTWWGTDKLELNYFASIPIALVGAGIIGGILQVAMSRLTIKQDLVSLMLVTLAFGDVLTGGSSLVFGNNPQQINAPGMNHRFNVFGTYLTYQDVGIIVVTLVLYAATWLVLSRTNLGHYIRGVAEDPKLARLYGINPARVYIAVFVFSAVVVALAGSLMGPQGPILTSIGFDQVIVTFLVVVLGGIGSILGALYVGFGLGIFTALFGAYISTAYSVAAAFAVLLIFLVIRPTGLKGAETA